MELSIVSGIQNLTTEEFLLRGKMLVICSTLDILDTILHSHANCDDSCFHDVETVG